MDNWFVIVGDDSGHEYVIPEEKRDEFYVWVDDEDNWDEPDYATRIEGNFRFKEWEI